ncbi:MAG: hypothetical protein HC914_20065, partial [Chloroflexaceae bacterium]|nr:hypothetical protein [Chloroflexaceae bacterium]
MDNATIQNHQHRPQRTLSFPTNHSFGGLLVRDEDAYASYDWDNGWTELAEATSTVIIPAGKEVFLWIEDTSDLSPLATLPPDALYAIRLNATPIADDDVRYMRHLIELRSVDISSYPFDNGIGNTGLSHL